MSSLVGERPGLALWTVLRVTFAQPSDASAPPTLGTNLARSLVVLFVVLAGKAVVTDVRAVQPHRYLHAFGARGRLGASIACSATWASSTVLNVLLLRRLSGVVVFSDRMMIIVLSIWTYELPLAVALTALKLVVVALVKLDAPTSSSLVVPNMRVKCLTSPCNVVVAIAVTVQTVPRPAVTRVKATILGTFTCKSSSTFGAQQSTSRGFGVVGRHVEQEQHEGGRGGQKL